MSSCRVQNARWLNIPNENLLISLKTRDRAWTHSSKWNFDPTKRKKEKMSLLNVSVFWIVSRPSGNRKRRIGCWDRIRCRWEVSLGKRIRANYGARLHTDRAKEQAHNSTATWSRARFVRFSSLAFKIERWWEFSRENSSTVRSNYQVNTHRSSRDSRGGGGGSYFFDRILLQFFIAW